jgi:type I restriction enzyme S subunit
MSFTGYEEYKNSGFDWLGEIPKHWKTIPLWTYFRRVKRTGFIDEELLSVYRDHGVILKASRDDNHNRASEDLEPYQLVNIGDLVINKMKAFQGSVAISDYRGIVSPAYFVFEGNHSSNPRFLHYLMRSNRYIFAYLSISKGIRPNQWDLEPQQHSRLPLVIPPDPEQKIIADFLDHETAKIDVLVTEQEKLIELLKEKRQAVISNAVTKGLDPKVKMKESGVEWLGDIPEHWEIKKIKWCLKLRNEKTQERSNTIALENIEGWTGRFINTESEFEGDGVKFNEGDVLFGKLRPYLAKVFRAKMSGEAIGDFFVLEPNKNLLSEYAERLLISSEFIDAINSSTYGTKMPRVSWEYFSTMSIPLPPKSEQLQISNYLESAIKEMDDLIAKSNHAVALLQERRTALISAAVTGQIDVRNSHGN